MSVYVFNSYVSYTDQTQLQQHILILISNAVVS